MKVRGGLMLAVATIALVLAGCSRADPSVYVAPTDVPAAAAADTGPQTLQVAADQAALAYQQTTLQTEAGRPANVSFQNPGAVQHNWVLVQPGQEQAVVDAAAPNQGNVPPGTLGAIVAGAVVQGGGGSETIPLPPLEPGDYTYLCTVPGHYASGMKGTLTAGAPAAGGSGAPNASGAPAGGAAGGAVAVSATNQAGQFAYQEATLTGPANQPFEVSFTNPQSSGQPHNWVLVQPGQEQAVVAAAAGTLGNVPQGTQGAIAAGAILQPGNTETVQVAQPLPPGQYPYICTFPGHYAAGMKGTLTIGP